MIFALHILGKPDAKGNAPVIDKRTHAGTTLEEAIRTAETNLRNAPPPGAYGLCLLQDDKEVHRWFNAGSNG